LRDFIGRVFGFSREIDHLKERIRSLSWDSAFGMWTRGAFLQFCELMPRTSRWIAFIDFNDIHRLNMPRGHRWVDERIRQTFSIPFRASDIIARWYSGDEIVILFDGEREGADLKLAQLEGSAAEQGLSFEGALGRWRVGREDLTEVVDELSAEVSRRKRRPLRARILATATS